MKKQIILFFSFIFFIFPSIAFAASIYDVSMKEGNVRLFYPSNTTQTCDLIILGVGTAMMTTDYDNVSSAIADKGYIVAIIDHAVRNPVKTNASAYAGLAKAVVNMVKNVQPSQQALSPCQSVGNVTMGGHSASGQAAHNAVVARLVSPNAVISFDPFDLSASQNMNIPALYWGFSNTTCTVSVGSAAKAAYNKTSLLNNNHRVLYQVDNSLYQSGFFCVSPSYGHCSFSDSGCGLICQTCLETPVSFYTDIANSVDVFMKNISAADSVAWKKAIQIPMTTPGFLYVDSATPK